MTKTKVLENVAELKSLQSTRLSKYTRNYRLYESTRGITLDNLRNNNNAGYYKDSASYDTSPDISLNIIKSCTDTLTSDMANIKARPYFSTVNGSWKDIQITKEAQRFFDQYFEYGNIGKIVTDAFRDACIFDTGVIFVNPFLNKIEKLLPWQVFCRPAEATYNNITRIYIEHKDYPTTLIPGYKGKQQYTTYGYYFDTINHVKATLIADTDQVTISDYTAEMVPVLLLHYNTPITGTGCSSIADILAPIQVAINFLLNRYKDASQKNPAQTFFVPQGSNIEAFKLNNEIGNIIAYATTSNMTSSPVTVSTPPFIDGQYLDGVLKLKDLAYEMVGISQTSATGTKQKGITSGVMLQTMENVENDRFQTQTDMVIRAYKDICRIFMSVIDPKYDILSASLYTSMFKWQDVVTLRDKMKLQFSTSDISSKDPSVKIQMIQMLMNTGLVSREMLMQTMDLPDLDLSLNHENSCWNAVQKCINLCIESDVYDVPSFIPYPALISEIVNTMMLLYANNYDLNKESIRKLAKLFEVVYRKQERINQFFATLPQANNLNNGGAVQQ